MLKCDKCKRETIPTSADRAVTLHVETRYVVDSVSGLMGVNDMCQGCQNRLRHAFQETYTDFTEGRRT